MQRCELERVADEYRADGYQVVVEPGPDEIPDFLRAHQLDMIARKEGESVVVGVRTRDELADEQISDLAAAVNARAGWRFDLVVTNGAAWPDGVPIDATEPDVDRIESLAETAERLLARDELEAAYLVSWSATEAALRRMACRASINFEQKSPQFVLKTLVAEGVLSHDQYDALRRAMRVRNAVAHGLQFESLDASTPRFLIQTVRDLLEPELVRSNA